MTKEEFAVHMDRMITSLQALRDAGQKEYAGGEQSDAFTNFNTLSTDIEIDRKKVLWVYAMKHRDGIKAYLNGHKSQRESVHGRIFDLIVYLMLLDGMITEEENNEPELSDARTFVDDLIGTVKMGDVIQQHREENAAKEKTKPPIPAITFDRSRQ